MKKKSVTIHYLEYDSQEELLPEDRKLLEKARESSLNAYAPYSSFFVGAAVMLENGIIVTGNNQENAAYPSGLCAERVALFAASANHHDIPVVAIAITARSDHGTIANPITPCGACRQVLAEYETHHQRAIRMIMAGERGKIYVFENVSSVLPFKFDKAQLKR